MQIALTHGGRESSNKTHKLKGSILQIVSFSISHSNLKKPRRRSTQCLPMSFAGLTVGVTVLEGTYAKMYGEVQAAKLSLRQSINEEGVKGFPDVVASNNISDGICHL